MACVKTQVRGCVLYELPFHSRTMHDIHHMFDLDAKEISAILERYSLLYAFLRRFSITQFKVWLNKKL